MAFIQDFSLIVADFHLAQYNGGMTRPCTDYAQGRAFCGLVACAAGSAEYRLTDGQIIAMRVGEVAYIPAGVGYVVHSTSAEPFAHYTVNFTLARADGALSSLMALNTILVVPMRSPETWQARLDAMVRQWRSRRPGYKMRCTAELYNLLTDFFTERMHSIVDRDAYEKTLPAIALIESQFTRPLTLDQLAQACRLSTTHFRRLFKAVYNASPIDYLLEFRLQRACDLLHERVLSIAEIAAETGFHDENYFCRCFRRRMGRTPGQYARML